MQYDYSIDVAQRFDLSTLSSWRPTRPFLMKYKISCTIPTISRSVTCVGTNCPWELLGSTIGLETTEKFLSLIWDTNCRGTGDTRNFSCSHELCLRGQNIKFRPYMGPAPRRTLRNHDLPVLATATRLGTAELIQILQYLKMELHPTNHTVDRWIKYPTRAS